MQAGVADGEWIAVSGTLNAGDRVVVRGGESLRGTEKLDIVGVFEDDVRSATVDRGKPIA